MRTITFGDALTALRRNGLPQIRDSYFKYEGERKTNYEHPGEKLEAACAIGQMVKNLHDDFNTPMSPIILGQALNTIPTKDELLEEQVISLNDDENLTFEEIANMLSEGYSDYLDNDILVETSEGWNVVGDNDTND